MLRLMLDHHPNISFQHELHSIVSHLRPDGSEPTMSEFYKSLERDWIVAELVSQGFKIQETWSY